VNKKTLPLLALGAMLSGCGNAPESTAWITLVDGTNTLANALFSGADEMVFKIFAPEGRTPVACNVFLLRAMDGNEQRNILIDTGMGAGLMDELAAAGLAPEDVTDILITHTHFDHVGGLLAADGESPAFPEATLHITRAELEYWRSSQADKARACEEAYPLTFILPDGETPVVLPNLVALDAAGHTPGHVVFLLNNRQKQLFAGDLLHSDLLQFANPEVCASFDMDREAAVAARLKILARAADENWGFQSCHVIQPGRVKRDGDAFKWQPAAKK
jgi:glyoxylase-like metal-dependent hydrolase (beta-lactamase superfamily II)